jgi:membrane protein
MPIRTTPQDAREVEADTGQDVTAVTPQPLSERRLRLRDGFGVLRRAAGRARRNHVTHLAQAMAFNMFLALPSAALVAVGVFANTAGPGTTARLLAHLNGIVPASTIALMDESLTKVTHRGGGTAMIVVGAALAVWSLTGAMQTLMWAFNVAYDREERRGFVHTRLAALAMLAFCLTALVLVFGLLVLGPHLSGWVGEALDQRTAVSWVWWTAQWPVLVVALLVAFAGIYRFGPDVDGARWRLFTPGALIAMAVWLGASGGFAWYVSNLGAYNKTWGSLAAVIVMLTWLWLSSLALLFGAEINAEADRTRRRP